jgi:hypothetical protein
MSGPHVTLDPTREGPASQAGSSARNAVTASPVIDTRSSPSDRASTQTWTSPGRPMADPCRPVKASRPPGARPAHAARRPEKRDEAVTTHDHAHRRHDPRPVPLDAAAPGYAKTLLDQLAWWAAALSAARDAVPYPA